MELSFVDYSLIFTIAISVFLIIDLVWLGWVAKDVYKKALRQKMRKTPNWGAAIVFYVIFIIGLIYFAIGPAIKDESLLSAVTNGALYGLFTYATYDLTNYATLKNWPRNLVYLDIFWGVILSLAVSVITYNIYLIISA